MEGVSLRMPFVLMVAVVVLGTVSGREPHELSVPEYETDHWWEFWKHHHHESFQQCYDKCFFSCNLPPVLCTGRCVGKCTLFRSQLSDVHKSCSLGCASSKCIHISTNTNPYAAEVDSCVNSCSDGCNAKISTRP